MTVFSRLCAPEFQGCEPCTHMLVFLHTHTCEIAYTHMHSNSPHACEVVGKVTFAMNDQRLTSEVTTEHS